MEQIKPGGGETWVPQACTLRISEQPLRLAEFDRSFAEVVQGVERTAPTRLHLDLQPDPKIAGRAAELMVAEASCCSFFTFILTVTDGFLGLDVAVPPAHVAVLDTLTHRASAAAGLSS